MEVAEMRNLLAVLAVVALISPAAAQQSGRGQPRPPARPPAMAADAEAQILSIVSTFAQRYRDASNDMARGAERPARARELCRVATSLRAENWTGTVTTLSSSSGGQGVLAVSLDGQTTLKTFNNTFSDQQFGTLIAPGTDLWQHVVSLRTRQRIVFSGTFFQSREDCLVETSLTVSGAMTDPDFIFRFTDVRPAD